MFRFAALLLVLTLTGCGALTKTIANADEAETFTTPGSNAYMDNEGKMTASFQGAAPTNLKQDAEGAWVTTSGQGGYVTLLFPNDVQAFIWSPKDGSIGSLKYTPEPAAGSPALEVTNMTFNMSDPAKVWADQFASAMTAIQGMTEQQAKVEIQRMITAGEITSDIAAAVLKAFVPVP